MSFNFFQFLAKTYPADFDTKTYTQLTLS